MSQKWTDLSSSTATDRIGNCALAVIQLSDGTPVWVEWESGGSNYLLKYSSDRSTTNTIATIAQTSISSGNGAQRVTVCRDSSDNLYVIGALIGASRATVTGFVKGAGYTWTQKTTLISGSFNNFDTIAVTWCNTGGGTSSKGHILLVDRTSGAEVFDAGAALAGSGTISVNSYTSGNFAGGSVPSATFTSNVDVDGDGFGATSGIACGEMSASTLWVGSWSVNSSGAATIVNITTTLACGTLSAATKVRCLRYASNAWALAFPSTSAGRYMIARYSSTAQLTAGTDSGAPTSLPLNASTLGWDCGLDPITASKVWVWATAAVSGGNQQVYRIGCTVSSGVTWDGAVTTDDLLTGITATGNDLRVVKKPTVTKLDWQVFAQTAASPTYALLGDYTLFNTAPNVATPTNPVGGTPIDLTATNIFTWGFSDPDPGDTQSSADLRYRLVGAGSWTTLTGAATTSSSHTFAGSTFTAGDYEWQVLVYDAIGTPAAAWSASAFFTAASPPATPTITTPTAGATIATASSDLTWSAAAQTSYEVRKVADLAGSPDTTNVYFDTAEVVDSTTRTKTLTFPTNSRYEHLQIRIKTGGLWSAWASVRVQVSYTPPATPTAGVAANTPTGAVTISATHPTPSGSQPAVTAFDVYRRVVGDTSTGIRVAANVTPSGSFIDYSVASGVAYQYEVNDLGANGTSTFSAWTA